MKLSAIRETRPSLALILLLPFVALLLVAGGASRGDVVGQAVVRIAAWGTLAVAALFGPRFRVGRLRPVTCLLAAAVLLALAQLVPLPPAAWQALPGRELFTQAATLAGLEQPWRPWTIVPDATVNALASLIVPVTTLVLLSGLREAERPWLVGFLLALVAASTLVGLLQFSGAGFDNPLINDSAGEASGTFANRNHFALFVALGCLLAPAWAFGDARGAGWRGPVAFGLVLLFALTILASGSRAGTGVGVLALGLGLALAWRDLRRALRRCPHWVGIVLAVTAATLVVALVLVSAAADRTASIDRAIGMGAEADMRARALPTVVAMVREYFPAGAGLGGFEPLFRMHEPFALLKTSYFNHAHNDLLEIVLDAGVPGLLLLATATGWWVVASLRAWRTEGAPHARLGSTMLLLIVVASLFDYPVRTPMIMAAMVMAAAWLCEAQRQVARSEARFTGR